MKYLKTDTIFEEDILNLIEDCIKESNLPNNKINALSQVLYSEFYFVTKCLQ